MSVFVRPLRSLVVLAPAVLWMSACENVVDITLQLIEPCDQVGQSLNGVESYRVILDEGGDTQPSIVDFTLDQVAPMRAGLTSALTVSVEGRVGNVAENPALLSSLPKSVGRSVPINVESADSTLNITLPMGLRDGFATATGGDGTCAELQNSAQVAGRHGHTATFVSGNGKVLIVGGAVWTNNGSAETFLNTAELFDPSTGTSEPLPSLGVTRAYHTATALPDGRVLIVGGLGVISGQVQALTTGLIYDPAQPADRAFVDVTLRQQRAHHTATLLPDKNVVIIAGGCNGPGCTADGARSGANGDTTNLATSVEIFDVSTATVLPANNLASGRAFHAASALEGGRLLVTGGTNAAGPVCGIEIFEFNNGALRALTPPGRAAFDGGTCPVRHTQVTLSRDRVAILGGQVAAPGGAPTGVGSNRISFWSIVQGIESTTGTMFAARAGHESALLADGSILSVGGAISAGSATAERLVAGQSGFTSVTLTNPLPQARERTASTLMPNGQFVVTGGQSLVPPLQTSSDIQIYYGN